MAKHHQHWTVLEHSPIEKLEVNLWRVEGEVPRMGLQRVMTVVKHENGDVLIHNPISLDETAMQELDNWGPVSTLVVPNAYHRMDCLPYSDRYPAAKLVCPEAATKKVSDVVDVDYTYETFTGDDSISLQHLEGTGRREGVLIVRHGSQLTLVFNDLVFNMPHYSGFGGFVMRRLTGSTGGPKISRISKMMVIKDKAQVADELRQLADLPGLSRIIVSHHETIEEGATQTLQDIANSL